MIASKIYDTCIYAWPGTEGRLPDPRSASHRALVRPRVGIDRDSSRQEFAASTCNTLLGPY